MIFTVVIWSLLRVVYCGNSTAQLEVHYNSIPKTVRAFINLQLWISWLLSFSGYQRTLLFRQIYSFGLCIIFKSFISLELNKILFRFLYTFCLATFVRVLYSKNHCAILKATKAFLTNEKLSSLMYGCCTDAWKVWSALFDRSIHSEGQIQNLPLLHSDLVVLINIRSICPL